MASHLSRHQLFLQHEVKKIKRYNIKYIVVYVRLCKDVTRGGAFD